jgi:hypothetical protein
VSFGKSEIAISLAWDFVEELVFAIEVKSDSATSTADLAGI